jgi:hypothetical protein
MVRPVRIHPLLSVALAVFVAGCGGKASNQPQPPDLRPVAAPRIPGALVVQCGHDDNSQELYSLANGQLRRLTVTGAGGVNTFSVHGSSVAISRDSDDMFAGLQAELALLDQGSPLRGTSFGAGQQVALRDRETMAFTRLDEHSSGLLWDAIYVKRQGSKARRLTEFRSVWQQRYVRGRLAAVVGVKHRIYLARNVGTAAERKDPLRARRAVRVAISRTGRAAYVNGKRGSLRRVHIMSATGKHERTFTTDWAPVAWSRDQDRLLAIRGTYADPHIGLLDATTGQVDDLGVLACGAVIHAHWRGG